MIIMISTAGGVAIAKLSEMNSSSSAPFAVNASSMSGVNEYILIEVDEGDNDEEEVITTKLHEFFFESLNAKGWLLGILEMVVLLPEKKLLTLTRMQGTIPLPQLQHPLEE